jgi:hypothetical protein
MGLCFFTLVLRSSALSVLLILTALKVFCLAAAWNQDRISNVDGSRVSVIIPHHDDLERKECLADRGSQQGVSC